MTVPVFTKMLTSLDGLLDKAEELFKDETISEEALVNYRLAEDMFPFVRQVQIACDNAKGAAARLSGMKPPIMEDTEMTLKELHERIAKTVEFLNTLKPEQFDDAAKKKVELPYFKDKHFTGDDYLKEYALPNFFFHMTVAYAILRSLGAEIGKSDYLGKLPLQDN